MRNYEGIIIINSEVGADASKGIVTQVQELITKNGGRIDGLQDWGKRRLAYKINKRQDGNYVLLNFQMDSKYAKKLEQTLRLNDQILRYILVNKDAL